MNLGRGYSSSLNGVVTVSERLWSTQGMPWCHASWPGCILLPSAAELAGHRYHMVVLPLSLGCVLSAVLVQEPDLLKMQQA